MSSSRAVELEEPSVTFRHREESLHLDGLGTRAHRFVHLPSRSVRGEHHILGAVNLRARVRANPIFTGDGVGLT